MSILTVVSATSSNDFKAATSYRSATFAAVASGNSLILIITALAAELPFAIEPQAFNGTTDVPMVLISTDTSTAGMTRHLYKLDNVTHSPTSIRYKVNAAAGSGQNASDVFVIGNTGGSSLTLRVDQKTTKTTNTVFSENFTTVSANELAIVHLRWNLSNPTASTSAPFTLVTHINSGVDSLYNADNGVAGAKTVSWSSLSAANANVWVITLGNNSPAPTVSSTTSNSSTEGTSVTHTVTLSGTTTAITNYATTLIGVTAIGTNDFTSDLASATYSNGVTFSGGNMVVPSGVSSFTVTIATTQDALDENDETYTLTVGGVSGTGTITDDDALPVITISDAVESFGVVTFNITLSPVSGKEVVVNYATTNGSKIAGTHYTATSGTLTFAPGETVKTVSVQTL